MLHSVRWEDKKNMHLKDFHRNLRLVILHVAVIFFFPCFMFMSISLLIYIYIFLLRADSRFIALVYFTESIQTFYFFFRFHLSHITWFKPVFRRDIVFKKLHLLSQNDPLNYHATQVRFTSHVFFFFHYVVHLPPIPVFFLTRTSLFFY